MNGEHLLHCLNHLDDALIWQHSGPARRKPTPRWKKTLAAAACVCLVLGSTFGIMVKLGYFSAGCGGWPGTIVNGDYYYTVPHSGVWRYTPGGESEKLLSALWMDGWLVNENGLYFDRGRSLYRKDLTTGKIQRLYTASLWECSHIGFSLEEDGTIVLTVYDKRRERQQQLLVDGLNGDVLKQLSDWVDYSEIRYGDSDGYQMYEYRWYTCGDDIYELVYTTDRNGDASDDLLLNGESVLPHGWYAVFRPRQDDLNGNLLVDVYTGRKEDYWKTQKTLLIRADGTTALLEYRGYDTATPDGRYLFFARSIDAVVQGSELANSPIGCCDTETGEVWPLAMDAETDVYDMTSDGQYLYTSAPWADEQACWRIKQDESGRPAALTLLDADIRNH